jgi:tetratricopeptide (TPR) repeat protein
VIFPLQRLADALLEEEKRDEAASAIERCVEMERNFFASLRTENKSPGISMTAPDLSFVRGDFATAEKLFDEKVRHFGNSAAKSSGIDVMRYQLHLAEAQQAQGNVDKARETLMSACAAAEKRFGPRHPRVAKLRRKMEALGEAPTPVVS